MTTQREDQRRNERKQRAIEASDVNPTIFNHLQKQDNRCAVIIARTSTPQQKADGDLEAQVQFLTEAAQKAGMQIVGVVRHVGNGNNTTWLKKAGALASKHNAVILGESIDRFIRHADDFKKGTIRNIPPTQSDLDAVRKTTRGVVLLTYLSPQASVWEVQSHQSKRGRRYKGKGGRLSIGTNKKRMQRRQIPIVLTLRSQGLSMGKIALLTGIKKATVQTWLHKYTNPTHH